LSHSSPLPSGFFWVSQEILLPGFNFSIRHGSTCVSESRKISQFSIPFPPRQSRPYGVLGLSPFFFNSDERKYLFSVFGALLGFSPDIQSRAKLFEVLVFFSSSATAAYYCLVLLSFPLSAFFLSRMA